MCQGENHYTKTSIAKIGENLEKYHKIHVKRRWIFYCVAELLEKKLLTRKARFRNDTQGLIRQKSSLLAMTMKGLKYLMAKRVTGAWKALKTMLAWLKKRDARWPKKKDVVEPVNGDRFCPSKEDWKNLRGIMGKKIE
jgi:hypothetical protein